MPKNKHEPISFSDKIVELKGLFIFIICAAVASILIMNLLILPVSVFAITHKHAFTLSVKIFFLVLFLLYVSIKIRKLIIKTRYKNGSVMRTISSAAGRKFRKTGYVLTSALLAFAIIFLMYFILSANNQLIYEMMK